MTALSHWLKSLFGNRSNARLTRASTRRRTVLAAEVLEDRCCPAGIGFQQNSPLAVGPRPYSVAVGDFNGDGAPDLVTANRDNDTVSVLLGNGAGGFGPAVAFAVGDFPQSVAVGDFNGDGRADLVTANTNSDSVSLLLGNGAGGFGTAVSFAVGDGPIAVAAADFNGNGRLDLVVANRDGDSVSVLLGNGAGGFGPATSFIVGNGPQSVAVADFNRDGRLDLATADVGSFAVSVLLGNGGGGFGPAGSVFVGQQPAAVAAGDFNGDGNPDLVTANGNHDSVSVLLGNGAGGFTAAGAPVHVNDGPAALAVADFTGDGRLDLLAANFFSDNVSVLVGNGAGGLDVVVSYGIGDSPLAQAVADFNRDGVPDVATALFGANQVEVWLNLASAVTLRTAPGAITNENGGAQSFTVALNRRPPANVTVTFSSSDPSEGVVITPPIVFTPANWNVPVVVQVRGVDDDVVDGQVSFTVSGAVDSSDPGFAICPPPDLSFQNVDNEALVVDTAFDEDDGDYSPGDLSLREAVGLSNQGLSNNLSTFNTIRFAAALDGQPINLTQGQLAVSVPLRLLGNGAANTILDAQGRSRLFEVTAAGTTIIEGVTLRNGLASGPEGDGGAILNRATLTIRSSVLSGNRADRDGGAISNLGTLTVADSTLADNRAALLVPDASGGGVFNGSAATATIVGSTLRGNEAGFGGAVRGGGTLTVSNSTVSGNRARLSGGGIVASNGTTRLTHVTVTDNRADSDDNGSGDGGGVARLSATAILERTIVADNYRGTGTTEDDVSGEVNPGSAFNLIGTGGAGGLSDGSNGNRVGVGDPRLSPLQDFGGPTRTHALLAGSPAIDASGPTDLTSDQRGRGRPSGVAVDIGAFESHPVGVTITPITDLTTTEAGGRAAFRVVLDGAPAADVTITFLSSNSAEGTVPVSITFTPSNWDAAQTVTVTGVNDQVPDGDVTYTIQTGIASTDPLYADLEIADVALTNRAVHVVPDPLRPGKTVLFVPGSDGDDTILINPGRQLGTVTVQINGVSFGAFRPTSRIVVDGGAGDDLLQVHRGVRRSAWLSGGAGNDTLVGGRGADVLRGGAGDDVLTPNGGRDVLIGGTDADALTGGGADDLLIGGTTAHDGSEAALIAVLSEWKSTRPFERRMANLLGGGLGRRLNADFFLRAGVDVFDDGSSDTLTIDNRGRDWLFSNS